ncbi:MAG: hypothetical protein LBN27_06320, partial [Prevotellaceae bacterium]|nr:hypothetical protein [Prevotellaceae bacterium]
MKKIFLTLILATAITSLFAQATEPRTLYVMKNGEVAYQSVVAEIDSIIFYNPSAYNPADGVLINGVVWAKYNVDAPGTFAATPESAGKFYQ